MNGGKRLCAMGWYVQMKKKILYTTVTYTRRSLPPPQRPLSLLWKKRVPRRLGRSRSCRNKPGLRIAVSTWPRSGPELVHSLNLPTDRRSRELRRLGRLSLDNIAHVHGFSRYGRPRRHTRYLRIQRFRVHLTPNHNRARRIMRRTECFRAQTQLVEQIGRAHV